MSKVITSPIDRWQGTVTLSDPLTYPQVMAFQDALAVVRGLDEDTSVAEANYALLPGVFKCVEKWELDGIGENPTVDSFPATPALSAAQLVAWLIQEVSNLFQEAEEIPKD